MRPSTQAHTLRWLLSGLLIVSLLLPSISYTRPGHAERRQLLQQRKASLQQKISIMRRQIRVVKAREVKTRHHLRDTEHQVRVARSTLQFAVFRVNRARAELHAATSMLQQARLSFLNALHHAQARLIRMYERGEIGYLDFLCGAKDYGDLLQRSKMTEYLVEQDRTVLDDLQEQKRRVARYQTTVRQKAAEYEARKVEVALIHERLDTERRSTEHVLGQVEDARGDMEAELAALERDSAAVTSMLQSLSSTAGGQRRFNTVYVGRQGGLPVAGRITSGFGYRTHPLLHYRRLHTGVDIAAPIGTPVFATGGGEVVYAGWRGGYGNAVIIDHGHGKATLYGHMSAILVHGGQVVSGRQQIGRVGSTGISTGPHCHYEVRINGRPVNPL